MSLYIKVDETSGFNGEAINGGLLGQIYTNHAATPDMPAHQHTSELLFGGLEKDDQGYVIALRPVRLIVPEPVGD